MSERTTRKAIGSQPGRAVEVGMGSVRMQLELARLDPVRVAFVPFAGRRFEDGDEVVSWS